MWIGTEGGGLAKYKHRQFEHFSANEGLTNGFVRAIYEDRENVLWVGTDRGLFQMAGKRFIRLDNTPEIPLVSVKAIGQDQTGRLWVADTTGLLTVVGGKLVRGPNDCVGPAVRRLYSSQDGSLWALNIQGVKRTRDGCAVPESGMPQIPARSLLEDSEGNFWIGTTGRGLVRFKAGKESYFTALSVLPNDTVNVVFEDREKNLWVGCEDGLLRLNKSTVSMLGRADGLEDSNVQTLYADRAGTLWIVTLTGQIYCKSGESIRRHRLPPPTADLHVRTAYQDSRGIMWFGTFGDGLIRQLGNHAILYSTKDGLRSNTVRQIIQDRNGAIWIASASGVSRFDGYRFRNYYLGDGLSYPSIRCMVIDDRSGDILVGTDGGLNRIHNAEIVRDSEFAALAKEKIWSIYLDSSRTLWLGTRGDGLLRLKSGRISRLTRADGLPGNSVFQILEDTGGKLWLSTSSGIVSIDRRELTAAADGEAQLNSVTLYGTAEGMPTSQMNGGFQPAGGKSGGGEMWFPSVQGAVRINPSKIPVRIRMPVLIEKVVVDNRPIAFSDSITIPPGHGKLEIDFTLCDLAAPQRATFRYKLEGFDDNWTTAHARSAYYTNVPPGHYRFRIVTRDPLLSSGAAEASLSFSLLPFFYQTRWFYWLLAMAAAGCIWSGFALYARQTRAQYGLLLAERTRLAREMHDTVIQGCVGAATLLEAADNFKTVDSIAVDRLLEQTRTQIAVTLEEARQAVWDLRHAPATATSYTMLIELASKLGTESGIHIETQIVGKASLDPELDRTILLVGREALRNAVAHGSPERILVRLDFGQREVTLEVRDNGRGLEPTRIEANGEKHFGIVGMRERVEEAGGDFSIESAPGAGTSIFVKIPLGRRST